MIVIKLLGILLAVLLVISAASIVILAFYMIGFLWELFHDTPSHPEEHMPKRTVQTVDAAPKKESVFDIQMREYQEEDERKHRERRAQAQAQSQWAMQEQMRMAQEAHDTAVRMHQEMNDTVVRIHQQAFYDAVREQENTCNPWGYSDDSTMDFDCNDYECADCYCEEVAIQDTFSLADDTHNNAVNDAVFTAQPDFSMFGAGSFGC